MTSRVGGWLPQESDTLRKWINKKVRQVKADPPPSTPVIAEFKAMVLEDPQLYMLFNEMLSEVPKKYVDDPADNPEIRDLDTLFLVFDAIMAEPPSWDRSAQVGVPINAVLDWPMGTKAGFAAFLKDNVNQQFKKMLNYWGQFLLTQESCSTLHDKDGGWFSQDALSTPHMADFAENFVVDLSKPYLGFTSWDNFFTREFRPGRRPVTSPDDDTVIVSAAESTPFSVQRNVKLRDTFWLKGQPYSLAHMMNNDSRAEQFAGGTVYQAFLSADSYHRWHAPVSGKIVSTELVPGTYYSEPLLEGFSPDEGDPQPDPGADEASQGYISSVATRGVIFIEADNPDIGLMCMIQIGMAEVSSVDITMPIGKHFKKGDQIGMFHFGGSTYCLIFGPWLELEFKFPDDLPGANCNVQWPVNSALATVKVSSK
jgi:phosphatidylserine decarboxylase